MPSTWLRRNWGRSLLSNRFHRGIRALQNCVAALAVLVAFSDAPLAVASPADFRVIHTFSPIDGGLLMNVIQASDGNAYGTALGWSDNFDGLIFKVQPNGLATVLHRLNGTSDGGAPMGLTEGPDGWLYGMAQRGGARGQGTIFKISKGGEFQVMHDFGAQSPDGASPESTLVLANDGNLYGAAGPVFRLALDGTVTVIKQFDIDADKGANAQSLMQAPDGWLYGTTLFGAMDTNCWQVGGCGAVFKLSLQGELAWMNPMASEGHSPWGVVWGGDGNLYAVAGTVRGCRGSGCGVLLRVTTSGKVQVVFKFDGVDGAGPSALAPGPDGALYGATSRGGHKYRCWRCAGTLFRLAPDGTLTTLHTFMGVPDGAGPIALFFGSDGALYGAAAGGGVYHGGTLFRLHVPPP
jgi:uncharacterized repeat protein (TIGR03803 family)